MSLSVLKIGYGKFCLYDSKKEECILEGDQESMFKWKHIIEEYQQSKSNFEHMAKLKQERLNILISGGNSEDEANNFLKQQMPFLYEL